MSAAAVMVTHLAKPDSALMQAVWPGIVGQAQFCRLCRTVLDCRRAVDVGVAADGKPVEAWTICATCYEDRFVPFLASGELQDRVAQKLGKVPWGGPPEDTRTVPLFDGIDPAEQPEGTVRVTVEIIDGRVVMG
tara:strand:+ start:3220 stop:3621 length:402 start_codon:yes stop_codon:yes gene_type:complete